MLAVTGVSGKVHPWQLYIADLEQMILSRYSENMYQTIVPYLHYGLELVGTALKKCSFSDKHSTSTTQPHYYRWPCGKISLVDTKPFANDNYVYTYTRNKHLYLKWFLNTKGLMYALNLTFIHVNLKASMFKCHLESLMTAPPRDNNIYLLIDVKPICGNNLPHEVIHQSGNVIIQYTQHLGYYFKSGSFSILYQVTTRDNHLTQVSEYFIPLGKSFRISMNVPQLTFEQQQTVSYIVKGMVSFNVFLNVRFRKRLWDCLDIEIHDGPTRYAPKLSHSYIGKYSKHLLYICHSQFLICSSLV